MPSPDLGRVLLAHARAAIAAALGRVCVPPPDVPELARLGATFITLKLDGALRGCIGSLEPVRPLRQDVRDNAVGAAMRDPRFPPLTPREFDRVRIEVSLLSAPEDLHVENEAGLLGRLRPGVDGLVLRYGRLRATFLPQVWEELPEPRAFVVALKRKAGLAADFWHPALTVSRYQVAKWSESDAAAPI